MLGSRPGRYTAEQRTRVIEEVKRLEMQTKFNRNGTLVKPTKHEKQMDDLVKLLTETRLDAVPKTSKRLETDLDCEKKFLVCRLLHNYLDILFEQLHKACEILLNQFKLLSH